MADRSIRSWFAAGEPEGLGDEQRSFVELLGARLAELCPAGVDPLETAVRAEPGLGDLVVPHRYFRGLSVAARVGGGQAEIFWLRVRTLARSDDFDLASGAGWPVFSSEQHGGGWEQGAVDRFATELARPFTVRVQRLGRNPRPTKTEILLDDEAMWSETRLRAALPGQKTAQFDAAFITPIAEIRRLLARNAA